MTGLTIVINPLGAALSHYGRELVDVLEASGATVDMIDFPEPSAANSSRSSWVWRYVRELWSVRRRRRGTSDSLPVIVTWPVVGYLDLVVLALILPGAWLTVHDPVPLVRSIGYGRIARLVARTIGKRSKIIVLSGAAAIEVRRSLPRAALEVLPHPMFEPAHKPQRGNDVVIRVLGQYKADRDLPLLRAIATTGSAAEYLVTGRGWPEVDGWKVDDRFVPEEELDELIRTASVVLIPYRRFFQSGIAVRCLELGTPVVGPRDSSLQDLLGSQPELRAGPPAPEWSRAVEAALVLSATDLNALGAVQRASAIGRWASL